MKKELKASNRHRRLAFQQLDDIAGKIIQRPDEAEAPANDPPRRNKKSKASVILAAAAALAAH